MKKIASYTATVLSSAILFTGCSGGDDKSSSALNPSPKISVKTETVTVKPEAPSTVPSSSKNEIFLSVLRDHGDTYTGAPDADLIELGHQTCDTLDMGVTVEDMAAYMVQENIDPDFAGFLIGAAVGVFCPEYTNQIDGGTGA